MDDVLFEDGSRRLKISVTGLDPETATVTAESFRLTLYAFDQLPTVKSLFTAELNIEQAAALHAYLNSISLVRDRARSVSGRFVEIQQSVPKAVTDAFLDHPDLLSDPDVVRAVLTLNPDLCRAIIETELSALDVQSLAYRREQLQIMSRLLEEPDFFQEYQRTKNARGPEEVWQQFFEANQWILGLGLHYVIGEGVQPDKLEQVVAGHSIAATGKRVDSLLQTRGVVRSLCYVEIKTHETALLHQTEYRPDVWRPSTELSGAVAQSQKTVQLAIEHLSSVFELPLNASHHGGERFFNYAPRAIVVCGSLSQFVEGEVTNIPKFSSFELYRRSMQSPDIVTYDELHERASAMVETGLAQRTSQGEAAELGEEAGNDATSES